MKRYRPWMLVGFVVIAGCAEEPAARDPLAPYPSTGVTREFNFTVDETMWEVGPGALYKAIAYNGVVPGHALIAIIHSMDRMNPFGHSE